MTSKRTNLFTVIGYCDGDYSVETFVERVKAHDASDAWDIAVKRVTKNGDNKSDNATEIATFDGWLDPSERYMRAPRKAPGEIVRQLAAHLGWGVTDPETKPGWVDPAGNVWNDNEIIEIVT